MFNGRKLWIAIRKKNMPLILLLLLLLDSNEIKWRANGDFKLQYWRFQKGESIHFWHLFNILFASPRKRLYLHFCKTSKTHMHATYCSFQVKWTLVAVKTPLPFSIHRKYDYGKGYWHIFSWFLAQYFITSKLFIAHF